jgi:hypothetical protein
VSVVISNRAPPAPPKQKFDGAWDPDLAQQLSLRVEHLDAGERRGIDPALAVDLQPVREPGRDDREQPLTGEAATVHHVECLDVVRTRHVVAAWLLVGAAVGDVQDAGVGREGDAVGLVEGVGDDGGLTGRGVVPVHVVADHRWRPESLEMAVGRIGEPNRAVAGNNDVVGRVERQAPPVVNERRPLAGPPVDSGDACGLPAAALLAHDQVAAEVGRHAVGAVRLLHEHRHAVGFTQGQPLDLNRRRAVGAGPRRRGEVQSVLVREVDGTFVRIDLGEQRQPGKVADDLVELRRVRDESRVGGGRGHEIRPLALSISQAAVISPMWLNACGKLPSNSPFAVSISSARSPRSFA